MNFYTNTNFVLLFLYNGVHYHTNLIMFPAQYINFCIAMIEINFKISFELIFCRIWCCCAVSSNADILKNIEVIKFTEVEVGVDWVINILVSEKLRKRPVKFESTNGVSRFATVTKVNVFLFVIYITDYRSCCAFILIRYTPIP